MNVSKGPYKTSKQIFESQIKASNMSITEQIEWWKSALEQYSYDYTAVLDCNEKIFSLTRKLVDELNTMSEIYVEERDKLNNWSDFGDNAIDAFGRIRDRNFEFLKQGTITWEEYCDTISEIGSNMYNERIEYSKNWLNQQYKYNNMSVEDYIAGLDRMAAYTQEYYNNGLIGEVDYFYGMQDISNKKADMTDVLNNQKYQGWQNSAEMWKKQRETYGDWDEYGDSLTDFYQRCITRQEEFYSAGIIDWETYNNAVINYRMELYKAEKAEAEDTYNSMLKSAKAYINKVKSDFQSQKDDLDYEYETYKLNRDYDKAYREKSIYKNAVTSRGKEVYEAAVDELNTIQYERESLELERRQTQTLESLNASYQLLEDSKDVIVTQIMDGSLNVSAVLNNASAQISQSQSSICALLSELISVTKSASLNGTVYGNTTYNISGADSSFVNAILQRSASSIAYGYGG